MPGYSLSLVAALLFSLAGQALAQTNAASTNTPLPTTPASQTIQTATSQTATSPTTASHHAPATRTDTAAAHFPVRLVPRSETASASASATRSRYGKPLKMPAPSDRRTADGDVQGDSRKATAGHVTSVVFSSLAIVLGLFLLVAWLVRRALPKSATALPTDVLEVLGRSALASRHNLQLIRLGRRLLLVSVTPDNAETLAEITDPDEVNHLAGLCRQDQPSSITGSFRQVLQQLGTQQPARSRRSRRSAESMNVAPTVTADQRTSLRNARELS